MEREQAQVEATRVARARSGVGGKSAQSGLARGGPLPLQAGLLFSLQQTAGNRAVSGLVQRLRDGSEAAGLLRFAPVQREGRAEDEESLQGRFAQAQRQGRDHGTEPEATSSNGIVQRVKLDQWQTKDAERLLAKRSAEWPAGADDMVTWAKSWKQVVAFINNYTHAQWSDIRNLFPNGMENVTKDAIDTKVAEERTRLDLLTPLNGRVLKASALARRIRIIEGTALRNPAAVRTLRGIDPDMSHWAKYTTRQYDGGTGNEKDNYQVHFYYNSVTQVVCTTQDYKIVFQDDTETDI